MWRFTILPDKSSSSQNIVLILCWLYQTSERTLWNLNSYISLSDFLYSNTSCKMFSDKHISLPWANQLWVGEFLLNLIYSLLTQTSDHWFKYWEKEQLKNHLGKYLSLVWVTHSPGTYLSFCGSPSVADPKGYLSSMKLPYSFHSYHALFAVQSQKCISFSEQTLGKRLVNRFAWDEATSSTHK